MRASAIFGGFLIIFAAVVLFMLPVTSAVYDFRTDVREDIFNYETGVGETTANVSLHKPIYDDDTSTITILSDLATDVPLFSAYNTTTRLLDMTGLIASENRTLTVSYDITALSGADAIDTLIGWYTYIYYLCIACLPPAGLYAIIKGRA